MRNSAFSTVTTNSRGVKSSLMRMTLCRRGRSVLVRTLVLGLVTVSIIPGGTSWSVFKRSMPSDLIRGRYRVASRKRVKQKIGASVLIQSEPKKTLGGGPRVDQLARHS